MEDWKVRLIESLNDERSGPYESLLTLGISSWDFYEELRRFFPEAIGSDLTRFSSGFMAGVLFERGGRDA